VKGPKREEINFKVKRKEKERYDRRIKEGKEQAKRLQGMK
jgi:hypothetical protein